jgi:hypothetical protein
MEHLQTVIAYVVAHPFLALAAAGVVYYVLTRKSRLARDADARFDDLRRARGDHYNKQRPLR